jgi:hypothetical protein
LLYFFLKITCSETSRTECLTYRLFERLRNQFFKHALCVQKRL